MPTAVGHEPTCRLLIVDDETPVRAFVDRVLRQRGYETYVAASGDEALRIAEAHGPFDLLLTDLTMPGMRGDELARRLRLNHPELKILYLTGYADELFEKRAALWEDEAFLEKPATPQGLFEAVSLLLVGTLPKPRSRRVQIPGARVHLADVVATLETLSVTGTLVTTTSDLPVGSTWPLVLDLPTETIHLTGRVVNNEALQGVASASEPPGSRRIALVFVAPPTKTGRVLQDVCGRTLGRQGLQ